MPNYYEMLQVAPGASDAEILTAYEAQYNQWRRLVTHHDPTVVNQANQALQALETIRETLSDPSRRAAYDAGIGLTGPVGGLADPDLLLQPAIAAPSVLPATPPPTSLQKPSSQIQRTDAWICPKCHTSNAIGTRFCGTCGQSLGRDCPNCGQLIDATAQFCSVCGANVETASRVKRQREAEAIQAREIEQQHRLAEQQRAFANQALLVPKKNLATNAANWRTVGCICAFFIPFISIPMWIYSVVQARKVLNTTRIPGDEEYHTKAQRALWWSAVPLGLTILTFVLYACLLLTASVGSGR